MKVKDAATSAAKWSQNAQNAVGSYKAGVQAPKNPWQASTVAAAQTYATAVTQAVSDGRFSKGVQNAGDGKWQTNSVNKGGVRYGPGVQASQNAYQTNIAPVLSTLSSITLPPRGPKGDPNNVQRVTAIATALRAQKLGKA